MKLQVTCCHCKKQIKVNSFLVGNRIELAKKMGVEFTYDCLECGNKINIHVDDVVAVRDNSVAIAGVAAFCMAVFLVAVFWEYGFITTASISIPLLVVSTVRSNQQNNIDQFNIMFYDSNRKRKYLN